MQDTIWVTRDGRAYLVRNMTRSHVINAIRLIESRRNWRREYLMRLRLELMIRDFMGESH
jgi:hypothetical protein